MRIIRALGVINLPVTLCGPAFFCAHAVAQWIAVLCFVFIGCSKRRFKKPRLLWTTYVAEINNTEPKSNQCIVPCRPRYSREWEVDWKIAWKSWTLRRQQEQKEFPIPGLEPGYPAWKASMLTTYIISDMLKCSFCTYIFNMLYTKNAIHCFHIQKKFLSDIINEKSKKTAISICFSFIFDFVYS